MVIMDRHFGMPYMPPPTLKDDLRYFLDNFTLCSCLQFVSYEPKSLEAVTSYWDEIDDNAVFAVYLICNTKVEFTFLVRPTDSEFDCVLDPCIRIGRLEESALDLRWKAHSLPQLER